jgi:signal transduction histidine kinase
LPLLEEDVKVSLEEKIFDNVVISLSDLVRLHIDQGDYLKAKQFLEQADTIITRVAHSPFFFTAYIKYYDTKATYYEKTKDFEKGLHYKNLSVETDKQYKAYLQGIEIQRLRFMYNYEAKQRDITQLTKQNESQQMYLYLVGSGLLIVILLVVVLVQRFYQKNVLMNKLQAQNEKINHYNEELLQNVEQISLQTKVIEEQNKELHASNQSKNKIFSLVSHDLRSPLAGLKGVVGLLKNGYLSMEELMGILPALENNLYTTLNLTEELLYWAKSQMEGMQASPTELHPHNLIQQTFATIAKMAEAKGILLQEGETEGLPTVWADENMIKAVLRNLATNAIKFCKQGDNIQISAKQAGEQTLLFEVKDTGTGMKPEVLDKMFKDEPVTTNGIWSMSI